MAIGSLDDELDVKRAGPMKSDADADALLRGSFERRSQRITALQRVRASLATATVILLLWRLDQLGPVGRLVADAFAWFPSIVISWLPDVIESVIPIAFSHLALLGAAVILALSLLGYRVALGLWESWGTADTMRQWQGLQPTQLSRPAIAFYAWTTLQVVLLAVVGFFGPILIIRFLGDVWAARDPIVQAWARQATWSLIGAGAFLGPAWFKAKKFPERPVRDVVLSGTLLAVAAELVVAMLNPGPMQANVSIPIGLAGEVLGLIVAQAIAPLVRRLFLRFVRAAQERMKPVVDKGPSASPLDQLGVLGLVAVAAAVVMALQPAPVAMIFGAVAALAGLVFAWLMATNISGRTIKYLGTSRPTPPRLRVVGWGGALVGVALLLIELARLVIYLATKGIPG
jgi:hypothetical protein